MAVFFELTTDVFKDRFDRVANGPRAGRAGAPSVRRPLRGLEVKEDTFAMLKVIDLLGREIRLYDSGSSYGTNTYFTNFLLQRVTEPRNEKMQVVETFGDPYIFFYGEQARFLDCDCVLLNSQDFNWQAEFWANYDQYLRGSKCAESGARVYLFYDDKVVEGYMVQAGAIQDAQNPMSVQMQFRMFLTNYRNISLVGDPRFPIRLGVDVSFEEGTATQWVQMPEGDVKVVQRGLIHDNWDEWTSAQPADMPPDDPSEVDSLIQQALDEAAANAANMDNVDSIVDGALDKGDRGEGGSTTERTGGGDDATYGPFPYGCTEAPVQIAGTNLCSCPTADEAAKEVPCNPGGAPSAFTNDPLGFLMGEGSGNAPPGSPPPATPPSNSSHAGSTEVVPGVDDVTQNPRHGPHN